MDDTELDRSQSSVPYIEPGAIDAAGCVSKWEECAPQDENSNCPLRYHQEAKATLCGRRWTLFFSLWKTKVGESFQVTKRQAQVHEVGGLPKCPFPPCSALDPGEHEPLQARALYGLHGPIRPNETAAWRPQPPCKDYLLK